MELPAAAGGMRPVEAWLDAMRRALARNDRRLDALLADRQKTSSRKDRP
jgi:hypothetical protein